MVQVKIFEGSDADELEAEINPWFKEHPEIEIINITQSESSWGDESEGEDEDEVEVQIHGNVTISIFYK